MSWAPSQQVIPEAKWDIHLPWNKILNDIPDTCGYRYTDENMHNKD